MRVCESGGDRQAFRRGSVTFMARAVGRSGRIGRIGAVEAGLAGAGRRFVDAVVKVMCWTCNSKQMFPIWSAVETATP